MSKQSEAKKEQGYRTTPNTCSNCSLYMCDRVQTSPGTTWQPEGWWADKNLRCTLGRFAVKKTATCNRHVLAEVAK